MDPSRSPLNLIEERYANDQFHLLVACIFLNGMTGERASSPLFIRFLEKYPTPEDLADANVKDILPYFKTLGLHRRAWRLIDFAEAWCRDPPRPNRLHKKYRNGILEFESEVAHLTGVGRYANDAWRIFCKDRMYGRHGMTGPEWKRVDPTDPYLRAYVEWLWMQEGDSSPTDSTELGQGDLVWDIVV